MDRQDLEETFVATEDRPEYGVEAGDVVTWRPRRPRNRLLVTKVFGRMPPDLLPSLRRVSRGRLDRENPPSPGQTEKPPLRLLG